MSPPEARLWSALRRGMLSGLKFRRQHPLGPYVLDFYCDSARLAVEVDGAWHHVEDRPDRNAARDAWMANHGVRTLRLRASLIFEDLDAALRTIEGWAADPDRKSLND